MLRTSSQLGEDKSCQQITLRVHVEKRRRNKHATHAPPAENQTMLFINEISTQTVIIPRGGRSWLDTTVTKPFISMGLTPHKSSASRGGSRPPCSTWFLGTTQVFTKWHLDWFNRFCTADNRVSLYFTMGCQFLPQNCPSLWRSWPPSNTWYQGPTRVTIQNGWSIGSAIFAGLTNVVNRQTDRHTVSDTVCNRLTTLLHV